MRWVIKATAANLLSTLPWGRHLYYLLQRHVTGSLPPPEAKFWRRIESGVRHLESFRRFSPRVKIDDCVFLEFGAGWDLAMALFFRTAGVKQQLLFDRERLARALLVGTSTDRLRRFAPEAQRQMPPEMRLRAERLPASDPSDKNLEPWLDEAGIAYHAPGDARATGLPSESVDCVTNTVTLEHISKNDIARIFDEMFRVLKPGGVLSCGVDMSDHYSHADSRITPWNFLRFHERSWRWINSPLLYQNRLRASSYRNLAVSAGFEICQAAAHLPDGFTVENAPAPQVHPTFVAYKNRHDLLATTLQLVCRKPVE